MAYRVQSDTILIDVYKHICDEILNDEQVKELGKGLVFDFDLVDVPVTTPITPRNTPRMYLLPQSTQYDLSSTANYMLTLNYQLVVEGFHFRNARLYKLVYRLLALLRSSTFGQMRVDGRMFNLTYSPGSGSFEYDAQSQLQTYSLELTVALYV